MLATEEYAIEEWLCPMLLRAPGRQGCVGSECAAWRWRSLTADDPRFVAAIKRRMAEADEDGKKISHAAAAKWVLDNRAELGLPTKPTHGWCGVGGFPEGAIARIAGEQK